MNTPEMYQLFQVLLDKIDTQDVPDIPVPQFLIFINVATDEYVQAVRTAFEENRKIGEDASTLVRRIYIKPTVEDGRHIFSFDKATLARLSDTVTPVYSSIYYLINAKFESSYQNKDKTVKGVTQGVYMQQDDITVDDPFNKERYADKVPVVIENHSLVATTPDGLVLDTLVGTAILKPAKVTQTTSSNLPEQLHTTLVKRAVELVLEGVESVRQQTFNK